MSSVSSVTPPRDLASSSARSNRSGSTPMHVRPNICSSRRYESHANLASPDDSASASTVASLSPTFRTVSIIPGIENAAPDRTETSRGSLLSPSERPMLASNRAMWSVTSTARPAGVVVVSR